MCCFLVVCIWFSAIAKILQCSLIWVAFLVLLFYSVKLKGQKCIDVDSDRLRITQNSSLVIDLSIVAELAKIFPCPVSIETFVSDNPPQLVKGPVRQQCQSIYLPLVIHMQFDLLQPQTKGPALQLLSQLIWILLFSCAVKRVCHNYYAVVFEVFSCLHFSICESTLKT